MDTTNTPTHPAGSGTAADVIAQMIHARIPHWDVRVENMSWIATEPFSPGLRAVVVATGQVGPIRHEPGGPMLIGVRYDVEIRIAFPFFITDLETVEGALAALTAMGMLPAYPPAATVKADNTSEAGRILSLAAMERAAKGWAESAAQNDVDLDRRDRKPSDEQTFVLADILRMIDDAAREVGVSPVYSKKETA